MENNNVLLEEVSNEVTEVEVTETPTTVAEENDEMSLGDAICKLAITGLAAVGAVTVGKKAIGGVKKLFGKVTSKFGKGKDTVDDDCESCDFSEEDDE